MKTFTNTKSVGTKVIAFAMSVILALSATAAINAVSTETAYADDAFGHKVTYSEVEQLYAEELQKYGCDTLADFLNHTGTLDPGKWIERQDANGVWWRYRDGDYEYRGIPWYMFPNSDEPVRADMHRLYNPNTGEHFYTKSDDEAASLILSGWNGEGIAWKSPHPLDCDGEAIYRLYNPNAGEHHYTASVAERDMLVNVGWKYEGDGWYSDDEKTVPLYRLYNPNEYANNHHYTKSVSEKDYLVSLGWEYEGEAWYGI